MTDRELLELAAKAAGIEGQYWDSDIDIHRCIVPVNGNRYWNPLQDDGYCARLEVACGINVSFEDDYVTAFTKMHSFTAKSFFSNYEQDRNKARRYASVRCAAEIGKTK